MVYHMFVVVLDFLLYAVVDTECKQRAWLLFTYVLLVAELLFPPLLGHRHRLATR